MMNVNGYTSTADIAYIIANAISLDIPGSIHPENHNFRTSFTIHRNTRGMQKVQKCKKLFRKGSRFWDFKIGMFSRRVENLLAQEFLRFGEIGIQIFQMALVRP